MILILLRKQENYFVISFINFLFRACSSPGMGWTSNRGQHFGGHPVDDGGQPAQVQSTPDLDCQVLGRALQLSASRLQRHHSGVHPIIRN